MQLKVKKENNNDIIEKLDVIISNQEKILKLLDERLNSLCLWDHSILG